MSKDASTQPKYRLLEQFAIAAKSLGHVYRLDLLELLAQGERSVEALGRIIGVSIANTSQHLQYLRRAGLVTSSRKGQYVFYRLTGEDVIDLLRALRITCERHMTEVDRVIAEYFNERDRFEATTRPELLRRIETGMVVVLDVRPPEEYEAGHILGAVNVPVEEIEKRLNDFPKDQEIIAYCRGAYCILAFEAVALLRNKGFRVRRLEEGYPEWKASGLPIESAAVMAKIPDAI